MNGEALKIHIPSSTYPQFVHNSPPSFVSKAFQTALSRPFGVTNGAKTQRKRKILGAACEKLARKGRVGRFCGREEQR
jgi:hypothetical protein